MKVHRHRWVWMHEGQKGEEYRQAKAAAGCSRLSPITSRTMPWRPEPWDRFSDTPNEIVVRSPEVVNLFMSHLMDGSGPPSKDPDKIKDSKYKT